MKLGQKELNSLTMMYDFYKKMAIDDNDKSYNDVFYGISRTILTLGIETDVKNNLYKINHSLGITQIEIIEKLIKKAFPQKKEYLIDETVFNNYLDEIEFTNLTEDEKIELKNSISYLLKLDDNTEKFKEKYNLK